MHRKEGTTQAADVDYLRRAGRQDVRPHHFPESLCSGHATVLRTRVRMVALRGHRTTVALPGAPALLQEPGSTAAISILPGSMPSPWSSVHGDVSPNGP